MLSNDSKLLEICAELCPIINKIVKLTSDYSLFVELSREYSGVVEKGFVISATRRMMGITRDLLLVVKGRSLEAENFINGSYMHCLRLFAIAGRKAVDGDLDDIQDKIILIRNLTRDLVNVVKSGKLSDPTDGQRISRKRNRTSSLNNPRTSQIVSPRNDKDESNKVDHHSPSSSRSSQIMIPTTRNSKSYSPSLYSTNSNSSSSVSPLPTPSPSPSASTASSASTSPTNSAPSSPYQSYSNLLANHNVPSPSKNNQPTISSSPKKNFVTVTVKNPNPEGKVDSKSSTTTTTIYRYTPDNNTQSASPSPPPPTSTSNPAIHKKRSGRYLSPIKISVNENNNSSSNNNNNTEDSTSESFKSNSANQTSSPSSSTTETSESINCHNDTSHEEYHQRGSKTKSSSSDLDTTDGDKTTIQKSAKVGEVVLPPKTSSALKRQQYRSLDRAFLNLKLPDRSKKPQEESKAKASSSSSSSSSSASSSEEDTEESNTPTSRVPPLRIKLTTNTPSPTQQLTSLTSLPTSQSQPTFTLPSSQIAPTPPLPPLKISSPSSLPSSLSLSPSPSPSPSPSTPSSSSSSSSSTKKANLNKLLLTTSFESQVDNNNNNKDNTKPRFGVLALVSPRNSNSGGRSSFRNLVRQSKHHQNNDTPTDQSPTGSRSRRGSLNLGGDKKSTAKSSKEKANINTEVDDLIVKQSPTKGGSMNRSSDHLFENINRDIKYSSANPKENKGKSHSSESQQSDSSSETKSKDKNVFKTSKKEKKFKVMSPRDKNSNNNSNNNNNNTENPSIDWKPSLNKMIVFKFCDELKKHCEIEGIFRISGFSENIKTIYNSLQHPESVNLQNEESHDVAGAFKLWLRSIASSSNPIFPVELFQEIISVSGNIL
eukprot:TRINITY_DN3821_c0_g1_i3.p1 TRINITY_DN3821_c0_g1~~TRINITY_DN3821_c0_g1_i3.p1  ORF type:complete len:881 (+),score=271.85 TRINITY_DN3821_c0_g1_i3:4010-6652(+)